MDKVLIFSVILISMVYLPDVLNCMPVFPMEIEGYEKDCVNYSCRYTGRIVGHVDIYEENTTLPVEWDWTISVLVCRRIYDCSDGTKYWQQFCDVFWLIDPLDCAKVSHNPCYCSGTFPMKFKFYPRLENAYYRLGGMTDWRSDKPQYVSKVFDSKIRPGVWDPVVKLRYWNQGMDASVNGARLLHSENVFLGIGALCAILLA
ncbi:uncharacterized protein LOC131933396 [Physella acuta]|uniref:uncharacterized protein LOC131933396 n=1 Tax=Physella acuta TaxID=109671 RepID=UPI0027DD37D4|nr:uncharacterized protein LOC131933396 [Physella acuta]